MKKILILLFFVPLVVAASVTSFYLMSHIGAGRIVIPDWYKEQSFEPAPINSFIQYWKNKAFTYGLVAGAITLLINTLLYLFGKKGTKEIKYS